MFFKRWKDKNKKESIFIEYKRFCGGVGAKGEGEKGEVQGVYGETSTTDRRANERKYNAKIKNRIAWESSPIPGINAFRSTGVELGKQGDFEQETIRRNWVK